MVRRAIQIFSWNLTCTTHTFETWHAFLRHSFWFIFFFFMRRDIIYNFLENGPMRLDFHTIMSYLELGFDLNTWIKKLAYFSGWFLELCGPDFELLPWMACWRSFWHIFNLAVLLWDLQSFGTIFSSWGRIGVSNIKLYHHWLLFL